jgi:hypothetical protein
MQSDHWHHELFRAMPDLVRQLIPELAAASAAADRGPGLNQNPAANQPDVQQGVQPPSTYSFRPVALKKVAHRPDGQITSLAVGSTKLSQQRPVD